MVHCDLAEISHCQKYYGKLRMCFVDTVVTTDVDSYLNTTVGTLIVATIYLQLIQNRYMFQVLLSFNLVTSIVYNPLPAMWKS